LPYDEVKFPALAGNGAAGRAAASELDGMWIAGFLDHDSAQPASHKAGGAGNGADASHATLRAFLSGAEIARLRELEVSFLEQAARRGPTLADRLEHSAYARENAKIRRALSLRGEGGARRGRRLAKGPPKSLKSSAMDNLLFLERLEAQAAIVIQRAFRRYLRILFWARYLRETAAAIDIQRVYRGFRGRRFARNYRRRREYVALRCQAFARMRAGKKHAQEVRQAHGAAVPGLFLRGPALEGTSMPVRIVLLTTASPPPQLNPHRTGIGV
jgi:hypothetical protein